MSLQTINPATGETLAIYEEMTRTRYGALSKGLTKPIWTGIARASGHARR
jgi:hypothetical protein